MAISEEQRAALLKSTRPGAIALLEDLQHLREVIARREPSPGEIRRLTVIIRRLLLDQELGTVAAPRTGKVMLPAIDNTPWYRAFTTQPGAVITTHLDAYDVRLRAMTLYDARDNRADLIKPYDYNKRINLNVDQFLKQRVFYWNGNWATRKDVIDYVGYNLSGVHPLKANSPENPVLARMLTLIKFTGDDEGRGKLRCSFKLNEPYIAMRAAEYDPGAFDPLLAEILFTAVLITQSSSVAQLEEALRTELRS